MKIIQFIGTRPELIKLAPVHWAARDLPGLSFTSYFTGQHVELVSHLASELDVHFRLLAGERVPEGSLPDKIASIIVRAGHVIADEQPDMVIVQGDTMSAFACAVAASYSRVAVAHVEAGLRTFDRMAPWPEENLRRQLTQIADVHFAPTEVARQNLLGEGVAPHAIHVVGNTVIDAVCHILESPGAKEPSLPDNGRKFGVLTMHRREMLLEKGASNILDCVKEVAEKLAISFVFPVHPSPMLRQQISGSEAGSYLTLVDPVEYPTFIRMLRMADLVITDSGGIQEEATFLKIPTICLRNVTERPEAVASGAVKLVGAHPASLIEPAAEALNMDRDSIAHTAFGSGHAARQILEHLTRRTT